MLTIFIYKPYDQDVDEFNRSYDAITSKIADARVVFHKINDWGKQSFATALGSCNTEFVIFSSSYYAEGVSKELSAILEKLTVNGLPSIMAFKVYRFDRNGRKKYFENYHKIIVKPNDNIINTSIDCFIFKTKFAQQLNVASLTLDFDSIFVAEAIEKAKGFSVLDVEIETTDYPCNDFYNFRKQYCKSWYVEEINNYKKLVEEGGTGTLCKNYLSFLIQLRFACNRNNRNKSILSDSEYCEFKKSVAYVLKKLPDSVICYYNLGEKKLLPKYMLVSLLNLKYNGIRFEVLSGAKDMFFGFKKRIIERSTNFSLNVYAINNDSKNIIFDAELVNGYCIQDTGLRISAHTDGFKCEGKQIKVYSEDKYFGEVYKEGKVYKFVIPKDKIRNFIFFRLKYLNTTIKLPLNFIKTASRLTNKFPGSYYIKFGKLFRYNEKKSEISIQNCTPLKVASYELGLYRDFIFEIFKSNNNSSLLGRIYFAADAILLRTLYWIARPFCKDKDTWITFDQLFKGGDNGEYFFRYVFDNKKNIVSPFYVINKDCGDALRLRKEYSSNLLYFNTDKLRFKALLAKVILATRVDVKQYLGFSNMLEHYFRDLLKYKVVCLQHGLSIQEIAEYQNRLFDNTKLYCCASKYEIENLLQPQYDYEQRQLLLTGLPRYDGLVDKAQRVILIAPTWRRNVTAGTNAKGKRHEYSESFKHSEYFKLYNSLINNGKLIETARSLGYKIVYLIHPILTPQICDFDKNDYVEILGGAGNEISYEKMLTEASLMVTDHSGIQYDFAYMKKPIVYYHPETLPPQYMAKTMNYEEMGFGPVCKSEDELVNSIISAMLDGCKMNVEYDRRVSDFFTYSDHNNCERIFEALTKKGL